MSTVSPATDTTNQGPFDVPDDLDDDPRLWIGQSMEPQCRCDGTQPVAYQGAGHAAGCPALPAAAPGLPRANVITLDAAAPPTGPRTGRGFATALHRIASMIDAAPELEDEHSAFRYALEKLTIVVWSREGLAAMVRAGKAAGAKITKHQDDRWAGVDMDFGAIKLRALIDRVEVCDRVVTGVREVVEEVPDPEALAAVPTVSVTKTVEDVSWVCRPILAGGEL